MTKKPVRITLRIDEIIADRPGLDRATLERALHRELGRLIVGEGAKAFGEARRRPEVRTTLPAGRFGTAEVAAATVKALKS